MFMKKNFTSIHRFLMLFVLLAGASNAIFAFDCPPGNYYYDNSITKWTTMFFACGKGDSYNGTMAVTAPTDGSNIWTYTRPEGSNTWGGATTAYFCDQLIPKATVTGSTTAFTDFLATYAGKLSNPITTSPVGLLLRSDGTLQIYDIYFNFMIGGVKSATYVQATRISDTQWQWTGTYLGEDMVAVSTNNPTLGSAAKGTGELEVQIPPTINGNIKAGDQVTIIYTTSGIEAAPSATTDKITISSLTGIKGTTADATRIFADNAGVTVKVTGKSDVKIYSIQGALISQIVVTDTYSYPLSTGIYLIKVNDKAYKFVKK
jgi:hypothetical protein